jgi:DNA polymerase|tara:strand:- start:380 stop:2206 length:1827 start_codon:yes stop_codon:yes gene_type:complete
VDLITLDFETFYSKDFSLTKLTTEEYIRDIRFEVIGVSIKVNDGYSEWASGTFEQMKEYLHEFDWANSMVLAHNTMFDGAILSWLFDVHPKVWADTLCMARSLHGVEVGGSLSALAQRYQIGEKGTEVLDAIGKHREDFTEKELDKYGDYCINDVELTYKLFTIMSNQYPRQELRVIDTTLRMFIEPMLDLDLGLLEEHLVDIRDRKDVLLIEAGASKKSLMSNEKFAGLLRKNGVIPPLKISLVTGKKAYAFAKTDEGFKALQEHPELEIQALVAARLGNKSTLEETRTQRFIDIAKRGLLPVPVRYYAAHTGRWGGDDKINLQNLPSRGPNGKKLKRSMIAPNGCVLIDCDSSQIEARVLAWLAGQDDLVRSFEKGEDVYVKMASRIYSKPEEEITKDERFVGKTTILGSGYGMGAVKFQAQMGTFGFEVDIEEARRIIQVYREANGEISGLWREAELMIRELAKGEEKSIGVPQVLKPEGKLSAVRLPSGLLMRYDELEGASNSRGTEYTYKRRNGRAKIYGGKFVENACQALARCIIAEQMLKITKKYRVVLTVHDSVVCCVPEEEVGEAQQYIESCMRTVPDWATGLPLDCESGIGRSYGECE